MNARERQIARFYAQERVAETLEPWLGGFKPDSVQVDELSAFHALEKAMADARDRMGRVGSTALVGAEHFRRLSAELSKATGLAAPADGSLHYKGIEIKECSYAGDDELYLIDKNALATVDEPPLDPPGFTWDWLR